MVGGAVSGAVGAVGIVLPVLRVRLRVRQYCGQGVVWTATAAAAADPTAAAAA